MIATVTPSGRTRLEAQPAPALPSPKEASPAGYTSAPLGHGLYMLFDLYGHPCGIAASAARRDDSLRMLNR